jgi:hypothetical protein
MFALNKTLMTANSQKAWPFLICLWIALVGTAAAAELRTWTFNQDGQMKTSLGGVTSFKKKGRIDAAFIRLESTNVVLLGAHREYFTIPERFLSDPDRDYVARSVRLNESDTALAGQSAIERNEMSRRKIEAAKVREDAAEKRRLADSELDQADKLDDEAAGLCRRASELKSQIGPPAGSTEPMNAAADDPEASKITDGKFKGTAAIASGAVQQLAEDAARIQLQAKGKRQKAADLQKQARELDQTAGLLETNRAVTAPAPANTGAKSNSDPADRKQNPNS